MSKLKELTWENHKKAERKQFAKLLMSGEIKPLLYATFLYNQYHCYKALEENIILPRDLDPIYRAQKILDDCWEIVVKSRLLGYKIPILETTKDYVNHVKNLDQPGLMSHLYVRHFGDMYGGSMIAKRVPGEGRMYQFKNKEHLIKRPVIFLDRGFGMTPMNQGLRAVGTVELGGLNNPPSKKRIEYIIKCAKSYTKRM